MGFSGTGPGSAPAAFETAHNKAKSAKRYAVTQRQGEHLIVLGAYHDKVVAQVALRGMVAKGISREELSVTRVNGTGPSSLAAVAAQRPPRSTRVAGMVGAAVSGPT